MCVELLHNYQVLHKCQPKRNPHPKQTLNLAVVKD